MLEGVKIICERIRAFPEEVPKWKHFMNTQVTEMLTDEEHYCIKEALKEHFRQDFNARVLDMINHNDTKVDPRKPRFKTKEEFESVMYKHTK
jgi:hypothetical protein